MSSSPLTRLSTSLRPMPTSILKQKNLYIVGCAQCDIWDPTVNELAGMSNAETGKSVAVGVDVRKAREVLGDVAGCTFHYLYNV
jgi:hypothetical protein